MTTELEALRRVAEAARKWNDAYNHKGKGPEYDYKEDATYERLDLSFAVDALDALDALPTPDAPGEVVEVRGVVGWDRSTKRWGIRGWSDETHEEHETTIRRCGMDVIATIRARVPLPRVPEVVGEVG